MPKTFGKEPSVEWINKSSLTVVFHYTEVYFFNTTETYNNMNESHRMILNERYKRVHSTYIIPCIRMSKTG